MVLLLNLGQVARAGDLSYPIVIHTRYTAVDPRAGGDFTIWLEHEKDWHGRDARLYPPVIYVDVTHLTPSPGSPPVTIIEVMPLNSATPEFYHLAGIVRFKVTRMRLVDTNVPELRDNSKPK
jgi:hypothetical protein